MKKYEHNYGKNPEGVLSTTSGYATETTNFGEAAFGILNKSTRDKNNFTTPEVVSSSTATLFSVGNGSDGIRKNIIELKADGTVLISGVGGYDGTNPDTATGIADKMQGIEGSVNGFEETIDSISVVKDETNDLVYTLMVDGEERGSINIPKDQFLKNVTYDEDTNELVFIFVTSESDNQEVRVSIPGLSEIPSLDNYVTLDGDQTITGNKTFNTNVVATGFAVSEGTSDEVLTADGGTISTDEIAAKVPQPDLTPLQTAIGSNTYDGTNYLTKETNLTDAVIQLDEEIKATNDNLALEHTNAEATYAKKSELDDYLPLAGGKMAYSPYSSDYIQITPKGTGSAATPYIYISGQAATNEDDKFYIGIGRRFPGQSSSAGAKIFAETNYSQMIIDPKSGCITAFRKGTVEGVKETRYGYNGVYMVGKTPNDLLHANGGTISIQEILSQVTVPTKVSELTNDSGYQTESQVAAKVSALVDSAPETLDTLNELAAALGDDPNFATTVTNQIAQKADKTALSSYATKSEVNAKISGTGVSSIQVVATLPDVQEEGVLYIVTGEGA